MYCIECGTKIPDNSKFCSFCGKPQGEILKNIEIGKDNIVFQSVEKPSINLDYKFLKKHIVWYLAWVLVHLTFLLIFSDGIFDSSNSDNGIDDFWPFCYKSRLSYYDFTEFLVFIIFPMVILFIISLLRWDRSEIVNKKHKKPRIILPNEYKYSNYFKRLFAYIFDFIILLVINSLFLMIINFNSIIYRLNELVYFDFSILGHAIYIVKNPYGLGIGWLYYSLFESSKLQATPGKLIFSLRVTNLLAERISFLKATGRYWSRLITTLTFGVGYILPLFSRNRQALHDFISRCLIVEKVKNNIPILKSFMF